MNTKKLIGNVKGLIAFFTICFLGIIAYITYFNVTKSDKIVRDVTNPRIRAEENKVLRGEILDSSGNPIAYSKREKDGKQKRVYNNGEAFAHVIGYSSYVYGKTGIELVYNDMLQGGANDDILGVFFRGLKENINKDEKKGHNVYLTIDKNAQMAAFKGLGNDQGAVAAINPKTGEVIALVSKPSYDPETIENDFDSLKNDTGRPFINRASQGYYPPGSVFKIITTAAVLENKPELKKEVYNCTGKLSFGDYVLSCQGNKAHGRLKLEGAFRVSCNYAFGKLGISLGYDNLKKTAEAFMFNEKIKSADKYDALNMRSGQVKIDNKKYPALVAQDSIGQHGVSSNPLHMALVASAIVNDGVMMKPYIVKEVKDRYDVSVTKTSPQKLTDAVDKATADEIKKYMIEVVKSGTGRSARIPGITVGGKTGSAEHPESDKPHSWFVSFASSENKEIAVAVIVENGGKGGGRAAQIAKEVMKAYMK